MKRLVVAVFLLLFICTITSHAQQVAKVNRPTNIPSFVGYVPDELVLKFKENAGALRAQRTAQGTIALGVADFDAISERFAVSNMRKQFEMAESGSLSRYVVVKINNGTLEEALDAFRAHPMVEKVEPIGIHTVYASPNDVWFSDQWHLDQISDHDVDAQDAWDHETGNTNIIVGVLDTGVRYYHKDLGGANGSAATPTNIDGNMWINWAEKNGTAGVDDDGNGYVDDWVGWDWVTATASCWSGEDCSTPDNDPRDFNGHGTHCAGNVSALNNNNYGTCASAGGWGNGTLQTSGNGVKVMALRIGWSAPYFGIYEVGYVRMDFAASAFYYAARNGAKIASCSWGSSNSGGIAEAVDTFLARGGVIFKAAGNDGTQTADYLCGRSDIVSVAATDSNDCKADFSTYGTWVDISAPGTGIISAYHDHNNPTNDYVAALDGTSMATPVAASVAALIWSQNPSWTAAQVKTQLYASADSITYLPCNSTYAGKLGAGRVNAYKAVNTGTLCDVAAQFAGSPTSGCAPLNVSFTDQSTGPVSSWNWDFGDGGTSALQNPSHQYTVAGNYTVSLTVTSAACSNTMTKTAYVTVSGPPVANFTGTPVSGNSPLTVNFTDQSTGNPTSWSWTFGDGGTSTLKNPSHTYNSAGTYSVSLIATSACGSTTFTRTNYITVSGPAPALHVSNITVTETVVRRKYYGNASVTVVDASNNPVSGVIVSGFFNLPNTATVSATTNASGVAVLTSGQNKKTANFCFEVTNLSKTGYVYNSSANVVTRACESGPVFSLSGTEPVGLSAVPASIDLGQNHPNPFNPSTSISFSLPQASAVTVEVFNILGERIRVLATGTYGAGTHTVEWNSTNDQGETVASGIYFYRLTAGTEVLTKKMLLMK